MYYFCPCCNTVKSDKHKSIIQQHVLNGHQTDMKFWNHYLEYRHSYHIEKHLISLWVNGFVLKVEKKYKFFLVKRCWFGIAPCDPCIWPILVEFCRVLPLVQLWCSPH